MELIGHVIGGQEGPASDGDTFETIDPWTRRPWARVARGTRQDVDRAVAAARLAFDQGPWPRMGYERRGRLLHRLGELIEAHVDELARADTTDMGKPISVMREADVPRAAHNFHFFADHARMRPSEVFPMDSGHHAYVRYDPAGVVAAIAPWNFPLMLETWKIAPALAWGNTVVLKPAEDSPASATLLARLAMEAGFPEGVLNVVHGFGPDAAGQWLTESPGVDRITFTGESATGRAIARAGATWSRSASSWAARAPTWCSRTRTWTWPCPGRSARSSPTRARCAWRAAACSWSGGSTTSSWTGSSPRPTPWCSATRRRPAPSSARWRPRRTTARSPATSTPSPPMARTRVSSSPTTRSTASTPCCSPRACAAPTGSAPRSRRAPCGSTASSSATCGRRSAVSGTPAGAGRAATTAASSAPSPRPW